MCLNPVQSTAVGQYGNSVREFSVFAASSAHRCCNRSWLRNSLREFRTGLPQTHRFHTMPTVSGTVQGPSKGNKCSLLTGKKTGESCSQMYGSHGDGTNGTLARITLAAVPPHPYPPPRHSDQLGSFSAARCIHRGTLHLRCSRSRAVRGSALSWLRLLPPRDQHLISGEVSRFHPNPDSPRIH